MNNGSLLAFSYPLIFSLKAAVKAAFGQARTITSPYYIYLISGSLEGGTGETSLRKRGSPRLIPPNKSFIQKGLGVQGGFP